MNGTLRNVVIAGAFLVGLSAVAATLILAGALAWEVSELRELSAGLTDLHSTFVDQSIDAGYEHPEIDPDDPLLATRKILLGNDVNAWTSNDVVVRLLYLDALDPSRPIDLYISTQGGWADNAFTIIDTMRLIEAPVNTWAIGGCYSSGALILAAGTGRRFATDDAILMVHANLDDSTEEYSFERIDRARYENVWRQVTELPESWFPMTEDRSYYLTAQEALRFGVVDEVVPTWPEDVAAP